MRHPLFAGIDESDLSQKVMTVTEQVDLLESEMARKVRELVWAQTLLKKDQIATKKRLSDSITD
jgi:hypothetical protein